MGGHGCAAGVQGRTEGRAAAGLGTLFFALWTARVVPSRAATGSAAAPDGGLGRGGLWRELLTLGEILYKTTATAYVADESPEHAIGRFQSL
ncbi:hypothetical protein ACE1OC_30755 [Streptomyces sp. DSM 116496]|uniref:hypothetical protein n=1 Tax=Streptomyces stoeckheimensis TaxID=3344656 RepID=UPI0038B3E18A